MKMTTAESLKRFRLEFKLTQQKVADLLGMSQQSYYYYESKGGLSADNIVKLAEHYNVSADYLLGLSDTPVNGRKVDDEDLKTLTRSFNQSVQALQKILANQPNYQE